MWPHEADLASRLAQCQVAWGLTLGDRIPGPTVNYVCAVTNRASRELVLKLARNRLQNVPEAAFLSVYAGSSVVGAVDVLPDVGALLLERIRPGTPLSMHPDDALTTHIAAGIMSQLRRPPPPNSPFPMVGDWAQGLAHRLCAIFDGSTGPIPAAVVERTERMLADLLISQGERVLLHGDLHHGNIVSAENGRWVALDPKGVVGEAEYEVGAWLRNPPGLLSEPNPAATLARRVDQLAEELSFDRRRLAEWAAAQAVLSAFWRLEDGEKGSERDLAIAGILFTL